MCLLCTADEVPQPVQHCPVCGCPIVIYDGAYFCTPDECWCDKQPNVGEWHALRDEEPKPLSMTWDQAEALFNDSPDSPSW